jgi:hypothetical protein
MQTSSDFVQSHVFSFRFFGFVPAALVPDNLKAAVLKAPFTDSDLNPLYEKMATHYETALPPARDYKPFAKPLSKVPREGFLQLDPRQARVLAIPLQGRLNSRFAGTAASEIAPRFSRQRRMHFFDPLDDHLNVRLCGIGRGLEYERSTLMKFPVGLRRCMDSTNPFTVVNDIFLRRPMRP